jgi:hypothetical protein
MRAAMRRHDDARDVHRAPRPDARHEAFLVRRVDGKARDGRRDRLGYVDDHGAAANLLEAPGKSNPFNGGRRGGLNVGCLHECGTRKKWNSFPSLTQGGHFRIFLVYHRCKE